MAGLIKREDIDAVREATRIDEVVSDHVTLRPAGIDSMKGLCPFHDERTPSFHVRPQMGLWHCFGCGEGGDVISFVQNINHISFTEAVEYLAAKAGITLHYEDGASGPSREETSMRSRILGWAMPPPLGMSYFECSARMGLQKPRFKHRDLLRKARAGSMTGFVAA